MPWVVGAVEHEWHQRFHAVEGGDFAFRIVDVGAYADAHVQPFVAVDQVVAAAAFEQVAAIAAQDDVAAVEELHASA
ncbi:hypothetical protein D3C78_1322340 [compost metagenome]